MTYVYSKSEICIYVDGILTCRWGEGAIGSVLKVLNKGKFIIGAGASEEELENFGGYIDDIYIYNQALDDTAVKEIGKKKRQRRLRGDRNRLYQMTQSRRNRTPLKRYLRSKVFPMK